MDEEYHDKTGDFRIRPDIDPELLRISDDMRELEKMAEKAKAHVRSSLVLSVLFLSPSCSGGKEAGY